MIEQPTSQSASLVINFPSGDMAWIVQAGGDCVKNGGGFNIVRTFALLVSVIDRALESGAAAILEKNVRKLKELRSAKIQAKEQLIEDWFSV